MKKLDRWLDTITAVIDSMWRWALVVLAVVVLVEQICIAAQHRPSQLVSLMIVLIVILSACGVREIRNMKKGKESR